MGYMKIFFIGMSLLSVTLVQAGSGVGNGGVSVVCRDNDDKITTAELLDIYEGKVRYGKKYNNDLDADTKVELAQLKLVKHPEFLTSFQEELAKVRAILTFIPVGNELTPTNDAFPTIVKKGCKFEQLANYTDDGDLLVSQEIYDHLNEVDKAALLVHETVYALFREKGAKDSRQARKLTAELLAQNADQKVIEQILVATYGRPTEECGLHGTIEQRIQSCKMKKGNFALVSRTKEGREFYKDLVTGLVWSDVVEPLTWLYGARIMCSVYTGDSAWIYLDWRLPSVSEYQEAAPRGLPNMGFYFWTSTEASVEDLTSWVYANFDGRSILNKRRNTDKYAFRCVGKPGENQ